jgi:hypothetical protein
MTSRGAGFLAVIVALGLRPVAFATPQRPAFPHDSQLLRKLHDRRFNEIGGTSEDKLSLAAIVQGFNHSGCEVRSANVDAATLTRYMSYWNSDQATQLSLALVKLHPLWLGTIETISNSGGCGSQWTQTTMRNLFALLDERTRAGSPPERPRTPEREPRPGDVPGTRLLKSYVMTFDSAFMNVFTRQSRGRGNPGTAETLRTQVSAIPGTALVLRCVYSVDGGFTSTGYWHTRKPAALTSALEASLPPGHPVFSIGPPRDVCPAEPDRQYEFLT